MSFSFLHQIPGPVSPTWEMTKLGAQGIQTHVIQESHPKPLLFLFKDIISLYVSSSWSTILAQYLVLNPIA